MAASFISNKANFVAYWHLTDKPPAPEFVAYWTNNGQKAALGLDLSAAIDPYETSSNRYSITSSAQASGEQVGRECLKAVLL